jgi:dTDP-3-amino-3,4,6-trideoxy-alpha-D-glucose transaminase
LIPFRDLSRRTRAMLSEVQPAVSRILESGRVLDGPELERFEADWSTYTGRAHAVGVASGTDALRLALLAVGVGPGDEVIVPAFTAVPSAAAVCATGATPVLVDVEEDGAGLDPAATAAAVTERTAAVIVVHLFGRPAPLPDVNVPVIEDCAHSHGVRPDPASAAAAYSFYPTKNLGGIGDGGAVVTDAAELAAAVALLRGHGKAASGEHLRVATNSRMSEIEAAALRLSLPRLDADNARRAAISAAYRRGAPDLRWQADHPDHVHHLCVARVAARDEFRAALPCETAIHYPRAIVDEPAYAGFERDPVPRARDWAASCVSLPCYPEMSDEEIETVAGALERHGDE